MFKYLSNTLWGSKNHGNQSSWGQKKNDNLTGLDTSDGWDIIPRNISTDGQDRQQNFLDKVLGQVDAYDQSQYYKIPRGQFIPDDSEANLSHFLNKTLKKVKTIERKKKK